MATVRVYMIDDKSWNKVVAVEIGKKNFTYDTFEVVLISYLPNHCLSALQNPTHRGCVHFSCHLTMLYCTVTMCQMQSKAVRTY